MRKILFVDDDALVLEALERMLFAMQGEWQMSFVGSPLEALELLGQESFDVIVSDMHMPLMDGLELLKTLRGSEETHDIPFVILTGDDEPALKRQALDLGATDLLNKPVNSADLLARVRSALRLKSYQDQLKAQNEILEQRVRERTVDLERSRREILLRLAKAGEYRDDTTGRHVVRVGRCCSAIARKLDMPRDEIDAILMTSPLHDIGKIGIPDQVLLKPGKLTPDERKIVETHCDIGAAIMSGQSMLTHLFRSCGDRDSVLKEAQQRNPLIEMASSIALGHHERWDGQGYPKGLAGGDIPLSSRILAVADVYDALTSERPYKAAFSEEETLRIMEDEAGRHFDPDVFAAFKGIFPEFRAIRAELSPEARSNVSEAQ